MTLRLAADIGGTKLAVALVEHGAIVERREAATPTHDPGVLIDRLAELTDGWAGRSETLGVAATGIVRDGRVYAVNRDTLDGWNDVPLADLLAARLPDTRIVLLNDAVAAAWAEYRARDMVGSLAFVTVSTGVGGGLVLDGRLQQGAHGLAGHIGHMRIAEGPRCGCGRRGCVEAIASGAALAAQASALLGAPVDAREVFARREADPRLDALIDTSAAAVATLIVNLKMALDIDVAVVGGSVGLAAGYLERVTAAARADAPTALPAIEAAIAGADAGLLGVADWSGHA